MGREESRSVGSRPFITEDLDGQDGPAYLEKEVYSLDLSPDPAAVAVYASTPRGWISLWAAGDRYCRFWPSFRLSFIRQGELLLLLLCFPRLGAGPYLTWSACC